MESLICELKPFKVHLVQGFASVIVIVFLVLAQFYNNRVVDSANLCNTPSLIWDKISATVISTYGALEPVNGGGIQDSAFSKGNYTAKSRKLLILSDHENNGDDDDDGYMNRFGSTCSKDNILVFQGQTTPLPNGIPTYTVDIQNVCTSGSCSISKIHLTCGWFSSARLINPNVFRRIGYDDCLVNDGEPMNPGDSLSFQYANTFSYPLSVSSVACM